MGTERTLDRKGAAAFLGVKPRDIDDYTLKGMLHPLSEQKGGELRFTEWDLARLKGLLESGAPSEGGSVGAPSRRNEFPERVWALLACPQCGAPLEQTEDGAWCGACSTRYGYSEFGALDLRPQRPRTVSLDFEVLPPPERQYPGLPHVLGGSLPEGCRVERGLPNAQQWCRKIWPRGARGLDVGLELGCGEVLQRKPFEDSGFEYLGVDYDAAHAHLLVDAHSLPFRDNSFPFITAFAFLEHLRYPALAMRETHRVLRPGGVLLGTVSFLEPFHMNSFYHHTHLGVVSTLWQAGFRRITVAPSHRWTGLAALAQMGLFPDMPAWAARALVAPLWALHRVYWRLARRRRPWLTGRARLLHNTGALSFHAIKS